jgi:hypothetical protein
MTVKSTKQIQILDRTVSTGKKKTDQQTVHTKGTEKVWRLDEELDKNDVCHHFCLTCTANTLPSKPLKGLETSK